MAENKFKVNHLLSKIAISGVKNEVVTSNKKFSKFIKSLKNFASVFRYLYSLL